MRTVLKEYDVWWDIFLAVVPVLLAYPLAWGLSGKNKSRNLPLWVTIPLGLVWLVFLPNTCYLLTEWRHLLFDARWAGLREAGATDHPAMLSTAKWALFFLAYSGTGVMTFVLAIRPMERWLRGTGQFTPLYAPFLFFLMSLGVYLGLIQRLNSWDFLNRPRFVWDTLVSAMTRPYLLFIMGVFALLLWLTYEAVDLWVDGIVARLKVWAGGTSSSLKTA